MNESNAYSFYSRFNWKEISDPIYNYVYFNREIEEKIINHILLQRLRYIMQLQTAHLVYPGAVHTRFQHSLGVMHLAGFMAEDLLNKVLNYYGREYLDDYSVDSLIQGIRISALLHDIGHACFSHSFEEIVLFNRDSVPVEVCNHERIGYKLYELMLKDMVSSFEREYGLSNLDDIVTKILSDEKPREKILQLLKWVLKDSLYPADILDYLLRDSYYTGTREYGYIDYSRLIRNTYPFFENNNVLLMLDRNAWGVFRAYLYAKANMYEHVYLHSVNRAFDKLLQEILDLMDQDFRFIDRVLKILEGEPEDYLVLTDAYMYSTMLVKALTGKDKLSELTRKLLVERKPVWKRLGKEYILGNYRGVHVVKHILELIFNREFRKSIERKILENIYDKLKTRSIDENDLWIDVVNISPVPETALLPGKSSSKSSEILTLFMCKKTCSRIIKDIEIRLIEEGLPLMSIFRVYIRRDKYNPEYESIVTNIVRNTIEEDLKLMEYEREYEKIIESIYSSLSINEYNRRVTK
ncbi:MAG: HD domain-containing protein [Desulfurococcaceae archaeon]